jgi:uroporphyrinogen-III synthase
MASIASRQGWRALVTRPREEADTLVQALAKRGVGAVVEPILQIGFRDTIPDLAGVQAILCTSANGVRAFARASARRDVPLFAVGDATAARARAEGFARVESAGGNLADLVRLTADRLQPGRGRLLHVSGSDVAGDLIGELRQGGFDAERCVLYEARPASGLSVDAQSALAAGEIGLALFYSPRTAAIFCRLAAAAGLAQACATITALSLSAATDAALDTMTWRERQVAARPDQPALLKLLDRILNERRQR